MAGNSESENSAKSFLQDFLGESWTDYVEGTITDLEFVDRYTTVERINNEIWAVSDLDETYQRYLYIKDSKDSYSKGVEYTDQGDLPAAINEFSAVVSEDVENYEDAQDKLAQVIETYQE